MKITFLCLALLVGFVSVAAPAAKDMPKYPVAAIPESLKEKVDVVLRHDEMVFRILARNRSSYYVRQVATIFNANGKRYAQATVGYDKHTKVSYLKATVYDANGEEIKKLKSSEVYDQSAYDGFSLYSDNRVKHADLTQAAYPYTVEFEYEVEMKTLFHIPDWSVVGAKSSVELSRFELIYPKDLKPKYRVFNIDVKPVVTSTGNDMESTAWEMRNVKPVQTEPYGPPLANVMPYITTAPGQFEYDGYMGSMDSWKTFGEWITSLNKGRDVLPEETKAKLHTLTNGLKTREEKIKAVYEYMQNRTRYVSIQLGIGGYQPFEASVVDKVGYGDCKALSNYTVAMLSEIGIKANYTLIRAGEGALPMDVRFPNSQFNHAVVCVPNERDTLWLECTSQTNPFGYAGRFTGDRKALAVTESGATVVNTPVYTAQNNLQSRTADVVVDVAGNARAKVHTSYAGLQYENGNLDSRLHDHLDDQKKWVQNNTQIPVFDINSFSMKEIRAKLPAAQVDLDLTLRRYASVSGKRIFLTPNLMNRSTTLPAKVENRKTKVVMDMPYTDIDTIHYQLPEGIYPEFMPEPVVIKSRFGEYEVKYQLDDKGLTYIRRMRMNKGEYPAESYQELIDFYKNVNKSDNAKLVFVSKT
jgi:transglutaminase-like putative cysteine protease